MPEIAVTLQKIPELEKIRADDRPPLEGEGEDNAFLIKIRIT